MMQQQSHFSPNYICLPALNQGMRSVESKELRSRSLPVRMSAFPGQWIMLPPKKGYVFHQVFYL
eukprot:scaffold3387_cov15-Tisochrysis_lutea.AAC.1